MTDYKHLNMLRIPSEPSQIARVETYVQEVSDVYGICESRYADVLISLTEAVNNAIIHGNKRNRQKEVVVLLDKRAEGLTFRVCDEGSGFDVNSISDPTVGATVDCCGGRGVYIIHHLADEVHFVNGGSTVEIFFDCL
jgi:serine/threonine-protein kinase RsbW